MRDPVYLCFSALLITPFLLAVSKNRAAAGLCSWVINIVIYRDILVTVEPKRQLLREANERLDAATTKLNAVKAQVAELQATLDKLTVCLMLRIVSLSCGRCSPLFGVRAGHRGVPLCVWIWIGHF